MTRGLIESHSFAGDGTEPLEGQVREDTPKKTLSSQEGLGQDLQVRTKSWHVIVWRACSDGSGLERPRSHAWKRRMRRVSFLLPPLTCLRTKLKYLLFLLYWLFDLCMYRYVAYKCHGTHVKLWGQLTGPFSPIMWYLGIELSSSGLAAETFTYWAISRPTFFILKGIASLERVRFFTVPSSRGSYAGQVQLLSLMNPATLAHSKLSVAGVTFEWWDRNHSTIYRKSMLTGSCLFLLLTCALLLLVKSLVALVSCIGILPSNHFL